MPADAEAAADGDWSAWIGRTENVEDRLTPEQVSMLAVAIHEGAPPADLTAQGAELPPLWHWAAFAPRAPLNGLGPDGHPARGGFLPPVPLERRMWAGGRLTFHAPLRVGAPMTRNSEILNVAEKTGAAGPMVFVTVAHRVDGPDGLAVEEEQDIVYLPMPTEFRPPKPVPGPEAPDWTATAAMGPVRLFRYSAATFNGHRIHYDRAYATEVEKYPGLVVHGPLQATLLLTAAAARRGPDARPATLSHRGARPMFDHHDLTLAGVTDGEDEALCTLDPEGRQGFQVKVRWA